MSILIKDMEMPTDRPQLLWIYPNGKAMTVQSDVDPWKELQAVPVPPHGRLIDADAAVANRNADMNWCYDLHDLPDYLSGCPTIIPADPEEEEKT